MELTLTVDLAHTSATLVEKHSFVAGDVYNPLYVDFSSLTAEQLAAVDAGTMVLTLRRDGPAGDILVSSSMFSSASRLASNGTPTPLPKMRQTSLPLNTAAVKAWFDEETEAEAPNMQKTAYLELSDANVVYAACEVPLLLRSFTPGGTNPGYYTKEEVDNLLAQKQPVLSAVLPLVKTGSSLSVNVATAAALGVVKVGARLSIAADGTLSANSQVVAPDAVFDTGSANAIQNKVVAEAVAGILARLSALDTPSTGSIATLAAALAAKANANDLAAVATSGSYNDLADRPAIPSADAIGTKWYVGTAITGTSANPTMFPSSGVANANAGDIYLNTSTGGYYRCTSGGAASAALWSYVGSLKGATGSAGLSGQVKAVYSSVSAMQSAWATDSLLTGELAVVNTGNVADDDNAKLYRKGAAQYEFLCDLSGAPGAKWFVGTAITGTSSTPSVYNGTGIVAVAGDCYINSSTSNWYRCTLGGSSDTAKWVYAGSIKGAKGDDGDDGTPGAMWYVGTSVTGTATGGTRFPSSGVSDAHAGDLYLNTSTGNAYRCVEAGAPSAALWSFICNLKGAQGDAGDDGTAWKFGTEVTGNSPGAVAVVGGAAVGDCYLNTSTGNCYTCTSLSSGVPVWTLQGTLKGESGSDGAPGRVWHYGTGVTGESTVEASITDTLPLNSGDLYFNTQTSSVYVCTSVATASTGTWQYLCTITSSGVTAPLSHSSGNIPAWGLGNTLTNGYAVHTAAVRPSVSASPTAIPTEYAVALAIAGLAVAPLSHPGDALAAWGDAATNELANSYTVQKTTNGGLRAASYAVDTAIPTEKSVRAAVDAVQDNLDGKRLDQMAAPQAGSTRLDATQAVHGLLSAADKAKLDGMASHSTAEDIGEELADNDTFIAFNNSESNFPRLASMARLWAYITTKLPAYRLDQLGVPGDTTDLNATSEHHGLLPKLPASQPERKVLDGTGSWVDNEAANTFVGDSGSGGTRGQVPAPAAGDAAAAKFLCADGRWAVIPGGQQFTAWTYSDSGSWALAWDEDDGWTVTDGTHVGTMSGSYARTATTVYFSWDDNGTVKTVTATRAQTSGVNVHALPAFTALAGADELLLHDESAGSQVKVDLASFAAVIQSFNRYDTLFVPAGAMTPAATDGASVVEIGVSGNGTTHDAMRFPYTTSTPTGVDFNVVLPGDWDAGTVKAKFVWRLNATSAASVDQQVKFAIAAAAFGDAQDFTGTLGTAVAVVDTVNGTGNIHVTTATGAITPSGTPAAGKMLHFKVTRQFESLEDSCPADVNLLGVLIQYRRSGVQAAW